MTTEDEGHFLSALPGVETREDLYTNSMVSIWALRDLASDPELKDRDRFREIILGSDMWAKKILLQNPSLTSDEMLLLAKDSFAEIREMLAKRKNITEEALKLLRQDANDYVRVSALSNPLTPLPVFIEGVLGRKFPVAVKKELAWNVRAVESAKVFESLWALRSVRPLLVASLDKAIEQSSPVDAKVPSFIHEEVRSSEASDMFKLWYASAENVARPEILDLLKDSPIKGMASRIAHNRSAWVSTHEYLVEHYGKVGNVRYSVASVTEDNRLLNKIYHGTRSKSIRDCVSRNPVFGLIVGFEG